MTDNYFIDIERLSPTHFYLSEDKLRKAEKHFDSHSLEDYPPLPVVNFCGKTLLLGGHNIAYYLSTHGKLIAKVTEKTNRTNFYLNIKLLNECEKKKVLKISDLKKRILNTVSYAEKWIKPFDEIKYKTEEYPITGIKRDKIADRDLKHEITYKILSPVPSYFANEFTFKRYIEKVSDTDYLSFKYCGHPIAFVAIRPVFDDFIEIYMIGICEGAKCKALTDKIMAEVKKQAKAMKRKYLSVKVPKKSAVKNNTSELYDFYTGYGFTPVENLESPWDEKRLCMLLIKG